MERGRNKIRQIYENNDYYLKIQRRIIDKISI